MIGSPSRRLALLTLLAVLVLALPAQASAAPSTSDARRLFQPAFLADADEPDGLAALPFKRSEPTATLAAALQSQPASSELAPQITAPTPVTCPILYYHEVPSPRQFEAQVVTFMRAGYQPTRRARVVDTLEGRADPPPGCLVLTFDDALASQIYGALPVLLQYHIPGTFFLMPAYRDGVHRYMTQDDMRTLRDSGMEIGSHTLNHASLPALLRLNFGAFLTELSDSRATLESILGQQIDLFAYPNGAFDLPTASYVQQSGYRAAASTRAGTIQRPEERFWLRRIGASPSESAWTVMSRFGR
jgi:peptidoglycan/xylan/chitin deacetylase (PgdA/CDA1 family)